MQKDDWIETCLREGEGWARAQVEVGDLTDNQRLWTLEFLYARDEGSRERQEHIQRSAVAASLQASERAADVAKESAIASRESAGASKASAKWTMIAAIATAIGAAGTLWQAYLSKEQISASIHATSSGPLAASTPVALTPSAK
jgi:hypothetical protein